MEIISNSPQETFALGEKIARCLCGGCVVALEGTLGSGKTYMAKGIASGLGIKENLTSPTYTIICEYPFVSKEGETFLYHIDAYRLNNEEDFDETGGGQLICGGGISVIEWSDRISKSLPPDAIKINIAITGNESRLIRINGLESL